MTRKQALNNVSQRNAQMYCKCLRITFKENRITLYTYKGCDNKKLCIMTIFRMKFKRDMYIAHLKNYGEGTSLIDDNIIKKLFDIQDD